MRNVESGDIVVLVSSMSDSCIGAPPPPATTVHVDTGETAKETSSWALVVINFGGELERFVVSATGLRFSSSDGDDGARGATYEELLRDAAAVPDSVCINFNRDS